MGMEWEKQELTVRDGEREHGDESPIVDHSTGQLQGCFV